MCAKHGNGDAMRCKKSWRCVFSLRKLTCFHASFLPFGPHLLAIPLALIFSPTFSPFSPPRKVLFSVERRDTTEPGEGAVLGWTSPQISGRRFLPEICVEKVRKSSAMRSQDAKTRAMGCRDAGQRVFKEHRVQKWGLVAWLKGGHPKAGFTKAQFLQSRMPPGCWA